MRQATNSNDKPIGDIGLSLFSLFTNFIVVFLLVDAVVILIEGEYEIKLAFATQLYMHTGFLVGDLHYEYFSTTAAYYSLAIAFIIALPASIYICACVYKLTTPAEIIHKRGRQKLEGKKAVKAFKQELKKERGGAAGLTLIQTPAGDSLRISENRETTHMAVFGAIGGGKTTVLYNYVIEAIERRDQVFLFDIKRDFTKTLPRELWKTVIFIAPWDSRGWQWDIAADIRTKPEAINYSKSIIPETSGEDVWAKASRAVLSAIIVRAQVEKPGSWDFGTLSATLAGGNSEIKKSVFDYIAEYSGILSEAEESRTNDSIIMNMVAFFKPLFELSDAWSKCTVKNKFSIRRWVRKEGIEAKKRTLLLQGSTSFGEVQATLGQSIYSIMQDEIDMLDDIADPSDRRIQIINDEFPQLGKVDINFMIELGRSKGVRVILGFQNMKQIKKVYSENDMESWLSNIGTYVLVQVMGFDTTSWLTKEIGQRTIMRYSPSSSLNNTDQQVSTSESYIKEQEDVISTDEWARLLGGKKEGVRVAVHTGKDYVYLLDAKHLTSEQKSKKRASHKPANWTKVCFHTTEQAIRDSATQDVVESQKAQVQEVLPSFDIEEAENAHAEKEESAVSALLPSFSVDIAEEDKVEIPAAIDDALELVGEPVTDLASTVIHAAELAELLDTSSDKSSQVKTVKNQKRQVDFSISD